MFIINLRGKGSLLCYKQCQLVELLAKSKEVMNSEQISDHLGISAKTVQRYTEFINRYLEAYDMEVVFMRGYGFILQGNVKSIEELMSRLFSEEYERRVKDFTPYLVSKAYITTEEIGKKWPIRFPY